MALKKKKQYEGQIEKLSASRMTVETQVLAIESANVNLETIKAMSDGAKAMKSIHGELNVDKVDKTMEDINDQMALANEISDAISQPTAFGTELVDEDDLAAELQELEQEGLDEQLLSGAPVAASSQAQPEISAPSVPKGEPSRKTMTEEEAELETLHASSAV
ncbi:Snf7 family, partial [Piptocephalis cylindrospora]